MNIWVVRPAELESRLDCRILDPAEQIGWSHLSGAPVGRAVNSKPLEPDLDGELDELREELEATAENDDATTTSPTVAS